MNARIPKPNLPNASGLSVLSFSAAFGPMIGMAIGSSSTFGLSKSWWAARRMATRRAVLLGRASIMIRSRSEILKRELERSLAHVASFGMTTLVGSSLYFKDFFLFRSREVFYLLGLGVGDLFELIERALLVVLAD